MKISRLEPTFRRAISWRPLLMYQAIFGFSVWNIFTPFWKASSHSSQALWSDIFPSKEKWTDLFQLDPPHWITKHSKKLSQRNLKDFFWDKWRGTLLVLKHFLYVPKMHLQNVFSSLRNLFVGSPSICVLFLWLLPKYLVVLPLTNVLENFNIHVSY